MAIDLILAGCGNMGYAMLAGWVKAGRIPAARVAVVEPNESLRARAQMLGVSVYADAVEIPADCQPKLVIFAVKPQVMKAVVPAYQRFAEMGAAILSIAAGTPVAVFESLLGSDAAVIRCMPNTPAAIGKGMLVLFSNAHVTEDQDTFVRDLISANGAVATIPNEDLMDAVTAVSGSGPAYIFHFIEALTAAGEAAGLPSDVAKLLAMQTVYGAGALAADSEEEPGKLRENVTSPNGTTAAALDVLMGGDRLKTLLVEAVDAAKKRSIELRD
ncbi:pyrroline-5-carboxylate reductase [Tianweitania sp. BSSL-BM11]|uniref:Pyrroline-5-carboxylate reductase n=1 Tax=Tianweitania aestuarii TaxID=2814886 RepID=A0ABS5RQU8_9HYPH|nr:pyrroline-5-carboxylate reductase [Tianweitania aestuarii]MBS9719424.1 pyrroline-5-carboxylate reductase [Tianweitania aestuarii]